MDEFIGIPFKDRGRTEDSLDCWGLVMIFYKKKLNINLPDFPISANDPLSVINAMGVSIDKGEWVKTEKTKFGSVVAMSLYPKALNSINHVGIYVGEDRFLHSIMDQRSALCRISDAYWSRRIKGFYNWAT